MFNSKPTNHRPILIKCYSVILLSALIFNAKLTCAQAPNIKYQTPQTYTVNTTISPLPPVNIGGAVPATIYGQVITFAGSAAHGSADGNGIAATFNNPTRVAEDANGNVFVADRDNGSVRKITPSGTVTTLAQGYSQPNGLCVDPAGNVFVADAGSNSIEKTSPAGVITNFASGFNSPYDVTIDAAGNLYVADGGDHQIRKVSAAGVVSTLAGSGAGGNTNGAGNVASFNTPNCVSLDASNNIYVSDPANNDIRMVSPAGVVSTIAGTSVGGSLNGPVSVATFSGPCGVAKDIPGNIYVADLSNNLIRKIDPTGNVSTLAGSGSPAAIDGVGLAASFNRPNDVQVDPNGFLYVDDYGNNIIRKVIITGYTIDKTLPAGLTFDPTTGIISGTPTAASPATNYTVTAYNIGGSSSTVVNIKVILAAPPLVFGPLLNETPCSPDFAPGATGGTGTYSYSSSNIAVATIINNKIHITGSGITNITVTDGINTLTQQLTVVEQLTITANIVQIDIANCPGEPNTYMVNYNYGITPTNFQWQVNNQNAGGNTSTFSSNTLKNNDVITCIVTDAAICTTGPATSNSLTVVFKQGVTPSVSIQSSAVGSVAPDTPITFTATPANGGSSPSYQWMINGIAIAGANNQTYTNTCLNDGDIVDCALTNNDAACVVIPAVQSNNITVAITAPTNPATVTITPSVNNVYAGTPITLTASVTNTNVINYQWQVNDKDSGNNSSMFSSSTFHNDDKVTCMITSQNNCHTLITSNTVVIELLPPLVLTIPNTFTPNGDGINDLWEIPGLAFYPNCEVTVYNRYGSLVYKSKGYSKSWDGNYNGAPLPSSTYYYIIDPGNKNPKVSGYVLILR
jgi:gliding motility-associated-like protein